MSDLDNDVNADEQVVERLAEQLMAARAGHIRGIISILFLSNGNMNVSIQGSQSLLERLGALDVARDGVKMYEAQAQQKKALAAMPKGGTA